MYRLWLAGGVCAACVAAGWYLRSRYRKRADVLRDLVSLLVMAAEQIEYDEASLPVICARFVALHPRSALGTACRGYPDLTPIAELSSAQWEAVRALLLSLGHSDAAGQSGRLAYARHEAEGMAETALSECRTKGDLYAKLCAVLGVGLMIWMV